MVPLRNDPTGWLFLPCCTAACEATCVYVHRFLTR